ncbi:MAG TPA: hypothetical protein PL009_13715 [Flavipsychrobacter sp.]|nr:hypothetical protein [Flavipsychrobacter sp.]
MMFRTFVLALSLMLVVDLQAQQITEGSVSHCLTGDGYAYMDLTPFPNTPTTRTLKYGNNEVTLSLQEAYRVRYTLKGGKFLDVKIEYPPADRFRDDFAELIGYYDYIAQSGNMKVILSDDSLGYASFFADRHNVSDQFVFLSTDLLVDVPNKRFIYVYYWNPNKDQMLFDNIEAFLAEKKRSIQKLVACLKQE